MTNPQQAEAGELLNNMDMAVNSFIKKWLPDYYAHLVDSDQNDGERLRRTLKRIAKESLETLRTELHAQVNERIDAAIAEAEKPEEKREWPQMGSPYFFYGASGDLKTDVWECTPSDDYRLATNNCHPTKEEAIDANEWLKALVRIRRSSEFVPNWNDCNQDKWFIVYGMATKGLYTRATFICVQAATTYYPTKETAEAAIADPQLHADYLRVYGVKK